MSRAELRFASADGSGDATGASTTAMAQAPASGLEVSKAGTKNIHALHVRGNVYMLVGAGCNITVQVGEQYVVVIDAGLPQFTDEVIDTIRQLTSLPIMFLGKHNFRPGIHRRECQAFQGGMGHPQRDSWFCARRGKRCEPIEAVAGDHDCQPLLQL